MGASSKLVLRNETQNITPKSACQKSCYFHHGQEDATRSCKWTGDDFKSRCHGHDPGNRKHSSLCLVSVITLTCYNIRAARTWSPSHFLLTSHMYPNHSYNSLRNAICNFPVSAGWEIMLEGWKWMVKASRRISRKEGVGCDLVYISAVSPSLLYKKIHSSAQTEEALTVKGLYK